jgi:3-deoxy-D-manno-octulosonic-acid transferase
LILVPRHSERFNEVASMVRDSGIELFRRSSMETSAPPGNDAVILLDTIGELSACWGLSDIAFVGGSFGNRGGQNMIEPAAFGAAVLFGPNTRNFRDVVQLFNDANACIQLSSPEEFSATVARLAMDPGERNRLGQAAQQTVTAQCGANLKTVLLLSNVILQHSMATRSNRAA